MLDLEAIKARLQRATPGAWSYSVVQESPDTEYLLLRCGAREIQTTEDADLIVHAPQDLAGLVAEVERLKVENDSQDLHICHLLDEADKLKAEVERLRDENIMLSNQGPVRVAPTPRVLAKRDAEIQRLREAIERHRATTELRLGSASPWVTDAELWKALDA